MASACHVGPVGPLDRVGEMPWRLQAVGVDDQLRHLVPVGLLLHDHPDRVGAPHGAEIGMTKVFAGPHFVGLGTQDQAELWVLTYEDMDTRAHLTLPANPPPRA